VSENTNPNQRNTLALTPGSDFAFNFRADQNVWTRHGNDTLLAFDPASPVPVPPPLTELEGTADQFTWQVLLGDFLDEELAPDIFARPELTGRRGSDRFILGDWQQPYYLDDFLLGLQRQAIIADFQPELDTIQLYGSRENYNLIPFALAGQNPVTGELDTIFGRALVWLGPDLVTQEADFDILAFFPDVPPGPGLPEDGLPLPDFNLDGDYIRYLGTTPPPLTEPAILQIGTVGVDSAFGVSTDKFGNLYVIGGTTGTLGDASQGSWDVWIAKYDSKGQEQWIKQLGTAHTEVGWDIETFVTPDGQVNFYAVGTTTGNLALELGGTDPNEGYQDIWLARFDGDGNLIWIQQNPQPIPGPEIDNSLQIDVDRDGNVYISGVTVEALEIEETSFQDFSWVGSFDIDGNLRWFNGDSLDSPDFPPGFEETYGISVAPDGTTFATGFAQGSLGGPRIGVYDLWLSRFDQQGEQLWITKFGSINYEFAWGVATDRHSNAYVAGWTAGDLAGPNAGFNDAFLAKYDKDGNQKWIKQFGTAGDDGLFLGDIVVDEYDNIYVTGFTDSDLGGPNQGSYDTWVASFDTYGNQKWITQFGSTDLDKPTALAADNKGSLFVSGFTLGSLGSVVQGATDAWLAKLDAETGAVLPFVSPGKNVIRGTFGNDTLFGTEGDDSIYGLAGNDVIYALGGKNHVSGGLGDDTLYGGHDDDNLMGDAGDDTIYAGEGNNHISGGLGNDTLYGGHGNDTIDGGLGDDTLYTAGGNNKMSGGLGNDTIYGGHGNDTIDGGLGNDLIYATGGNDQISGGAGDDTLYGGHGDDTIDGGAGNDLIYATGGNDQISGGLGNDTIYGGHGDDTIDGGAGNDLIYATGGNNQISGGAGNDTIYGGYGDDTIDGGTGNDLIYAAGGNNQIFGGAGNDTIYGGHGNDTLMGGDGDDVIYATGGNNVISGGKGKNTIYGSYGNDTINFGEGRNLVYAVGGDNLLIGGKGYAEVHSGYGKDTFVLGDRAGSFYAEKGKQDYAFIRNFNAHLDVIRLHGKASDYKLQQNAKHLPRGTAIFQAGTHDLIAVIEHTYLTPQWSGFEFLGYGPANQPQVAFGDEAESVPTSYQLNNGLVQNLIGTLNNLPIASA